MLYTVTGLFQNGRQFPVALLPPRRKEPLVVQGLKLWRPLLEDVVQTRPPALDPEPCPTIQRDTSHYLLSSELSQSWQLQAGEDQAPAGRDVQELQRLRLQRVGDPQVPKRDQDVQSQRLEVRQGFGDRLQRGGGHQFEDPEILEFEDPQVLEPREQGHGQIRPVEM